MSFSQTNKWRREYRKHWDAPQCGHVNIWDIMADAELTGIAKAKGANSNGNQSQRVMCGCIESIVNGRRVPVHRPEDCQYAGARSALVSEASRIATEKIGDPTGDSSLGYRWTAEFNRVMTRLAYNAGLLT